MRSTTSHPLRQSLAALIAATLFAACADRAPVSPDIRSANPSSATLITSAEAQAAADPRFPELGSCQNLQVPEGSKVSFRVFGKGVQIYRWNGTSWTFVSPEADLFADAEGNGLVGTHFGGPTWLTNSGSRVVGTVTDRCNPNPSAIDWLKLDAVVSGSGVFEQTKLIQRVNTVGGNAPTRPGRFVGEEVRVPYTSDYFFYNAP